MSDAGTTFVPTVTYFSASSMSLPANLFIIVMLEMG